MRLLWLYRPHRLWQRIGSAVSVFDLARYPYLSENYLKLRPDLLPSLFKELTDVEGQLKSISPIYQVTSDDPPLLLRQRLRRYAERFRHK